MRKEENIWFMIIHSISQTFQLTNDEHGNFYYSYPSVYLLPLLPFLLIFFPAGMGLGYNRSSGYPSFFCELNLLLYMKRQTFSWYFRYQYKPHSYMLLWHLWLVILEVNWRPHSCNSFHHKYNIISIRARDKNLLPQICHKVEL